jgi:hypothetical protein
MARDLEMTRLTMITSKTTMSGPLVTDYALRIAKCNHMKLGTRA